MSSPAAIRRRTLRRVARLQKYGCEHRSGIGTVIVCRVPMRVERRMRKSPWLAQLDWTGEDYMWTFRTKPVRWNHPRTRQLRAMCAAEPVYQYPVVHKTREEMAAMYPERKR